MKYRTRVLIVSVLLVIAISIAYAIESYFEIIELENKVIRLHILANSDTIKDQELKLKVRNNIIKRFSGKLKNVTSKKDSEKVIQKNMDKIKNIAQETIYDEGYDYSVEVFYDNYEFNERQYDDYVLPEGVYDTVRVEIGEAKGKNWWCVMFPPLCFLDGGKAGEEECFSDEAEEKLKEVLTEEEIKIIKSNRGYSKLKLKSKLYEIIYKLANK